MKSVRQPSSLASLAFVGLVFLSRLAMAQSGDGLAVVLSEGEVGTLQGPTYTTQILRGEHELLLVTRETGAGAPRDAYVFAKSATGWTRVAQLASTETRIEGAIQGEFVILFGDSGQALMQIKLAALRFPAAPTAPAPEAPAQPPAQAPGQAPRP